MAEKQYATGYHEIRKRDPEKQAQAVTLTMHEFNVTSPALAERILDLKDDAAGWKDYAITGDECLDMIHKTCTVLDTSGKATDHIPPMFYNDWVRSLVVREKRKLRMLAVYHLFS